MAKILVLDRIPLLPLLPFITIYQGVDICSTDIVVVVVEVVVVVAYGEQRAKSLGMLRHQP